MSFRPIYALEYALVRVMGFFVRLLPLHLVHKTGFSLTRLFYPLLISRRNVALQNLRNAFPEMNILRRKQIAFRSFQSVSATFLELLWYQNFTKARIKQRVHIENFELLKQLREKNKGIIFLTAHFGSWELAIQSISVYTDMPVLTIAK